MLLKKDKDLEIPTWLKAPFPFGLPEGFALHNREDEPFNVVGKRGSQGNSAGKPSNGPALKGTAAALHLIYKRLFFSSNYTQTGPWVWYSDTS